MLCRNGFRDVWLNPSQYDYRCFHRVFVERLDDQYRQTMASFITSSTRFKTLALFKDGMNMSSYITSIHNPNIRIIYTRLRIDMNCLSNCKTRKRMLNGTLCNLCKSCDETVDHFLLNCKHFDDIRRPFINDVRKYTQSNLTYDQDHRIWQWPYNVWSHVAFLIEYLHKIKIFLPNAHCGTHGKTLYIKKDFLSCCGIFVYTPAIAWQKSMSTFYNGGCIPQLQPRRICLLAGIILCMHPANERRRYHVTPSVIGWARTPSDVYGSQQYD